MNIFTRTTAVISTAIGLMLLLKVDLKMAVLILVGVVLFAGLLFTAWAIIVLYNWYKLEEHDNGD